MVFHVGTLWEGGTTARTGLPRDRGVGEHRGLYDVLSG